MAYSSLCQKQARTQTLGSGGGGFGRPKWELKRGPHLESRGGVRALEVDFPKGPPCRCFQLQVPTCFARQSSSRLARKPGFSLGCTEEKACDGVSEELLGGGGTTLRNREKLHIF